MSRHPLIHQGEGPEAAYLRQTREREQQRRKLERIAAETHTDLDATRRTRGTAPGDERKLRGIPVQARGVGGAIPGTRP